jgi:hypothetical protein
MAKESTIKIRRSATQGKTPTVNDLALGELAINTYDGKIFLKKSVNGAESIVGFSSVTSYTDLTNIPQDISTIASPTFSGITLNGAALIKQSDVGTQNALKVAGYVGSSGSVFAVGVSSTPSDGVNLQSLTSDLADPAKLTLSGSSIVLSSDGKQWTFTSGGNIKLPVDGDIVDSNNVSVLNFPTVKRVTYDNPIVDSNSLFYTYAFATDDSNNYINVEDSSGFTIGDAVTFSGDPGGAFGGLSYYKVFYIRTIPDGSNVTITDTKAGTTDFVVTSGSGSMVMCTMSPFSYQRQRAPRQWTNYDSLDTTGYDYSSVTYGDTYYDDTTQHLYIFIDFGRGVPEMLDLTAV